MSVGSYGVTKPLDSRQCQQRGLEMAGILDFAQASPNVSANSFQLKVGAGVEKEAMASGAVRRDDRVEGQV